MDPAGLISRGRAGLTACLALVAFLFLVPPSPAQSHDPPGPALLTALWTPEQLVGTAAERKMGPRTVPDDSPPLRQAPTQVLPALPRPSPGAVRRVDLPPGSPSLVALTFDLCELATRRSGYDGAVVDLLRAAGAKATFFASGKWMRTHAERTLQLMADPLFELGNHAWTHGNMGVMTGTKARDQVVWTQAQYEILREELARRATAKGQSANLAADMARIPESLRLFRLPYGRCSPESLDLLAAQGLAVVQWDVIGAEGASDSEAATKEALAHLKPGSILVMHANGVPAHTAELLGHLLPAMKARGLVLVTVSELLAQGRPRAEAQCYFLHPGDNLSMDKIYGDGTRRRIQTSAPALAPAPAPARVGDPALRPPARP